MDLNIRSRGRPSLLKRQTSNKAKFMWVKLPESGCDEEDIKNHFNQFGAIAEVIRPIDKQRIINLKTPTSLHLKGKESPRN